MDSHQLKRSEIGHAGINSTEPSWRNQGRIEHGRPKFIQYYKWLSNTCDFCSGVGIDRTPGIIEIFKG